MYDMHVDPTAVTAAFGCHIALCSRTRSSSTIWPATRPRLEAMKRRILDFFDTPDPVSDPITTRLTERDLDVAARAAVALRPSS